MKNKKNKKQAELQLKLNAFHNMKIKTYPHQNLYTLSGVVQSWRNKQRTEKWNSHRYNEIIH